MMSKEEEFQRIVESVRALKKSKQRAMCVERDGHKILASLAGAEDLPDPAWDVVEKALEL